MAVRATAYHEARHLLAASVGCHFNGLTERQYKCARVHVTVEKDTGEFGLLLPGTDKDIKQSIMALSAIGPLSALNDGPKLAATGDLSVMAQKAGLSEKDVTLAEAYGGPSSTFAKTVLAVQILEKRLGFGGFERLCKLLREAHEARLDELLSLSALVPWEASRSAAVKAALDLPRVLS